MEDIKKALKRIEEKLDRVIKAMQEYDGLDENFDIPEDEYAYEVSYSTEVVEIESTTKVEKKPKKKYHKPKKKKNETIQNNSNNSLS